MLNFVFCFFLSVSYLPLFMTFLVFVGFNFFFNFFFFFVSYWVIFLLFVFVFLVYIKILSFEVVFLGWGSFLKFKVAVLSFFLFIISEVMVFVSLFWSHFHSFYALSVNFGFNWPPLGIVAPQPGGLILFGTSVLMSSSIFISISHLKFVSGLCLGGFLYYYILNLLLGLFFLDIQVVELSNFFFQFAFCFFDSIYSVGLISTICLHSLHVVFGLIFLFFSFFFFMKGFNSSLYYINLELSIWYWHFVDYVWVLVFSGFYYFNC